VKRVALFLITNLAVLVVLGLVLRLIGFEGILDARGVDLDYRSLLLFALVIGMGGSLISLLMSKWMARTMTGARVIETPGNRTEAWLVETVRRQARAAGIGMPDVAVYPAAEINAFATGYSKRRALVAVSQGLLEQMDEDEAEAVLAHEVSHIANGDMVTLALIQGVVNTFVIFLARVIGHVVDRAVFRTERGHGPAFWIVTIVAEIALAILASVIVLWFSRRREFRADAGGARLAGRGKMIAALRRLQANHGQPAQLPDQISAFGISGGMGRGIRRLFMSHPPLAERIAALEAFEASRQPA